MPERWIEVRLLAPEPWCELIAEELATWTGGAAAFGRPSLGWPEAPPGQDWLRAFYPLERDSPAARRELEGRLSALVERVDQPDLGPLEALFRELPPEDWANSWRKVWRPFRLGHLVLADRAWSGRLRPDDLRLVFEPSGSFGTGRHATTRACLTFLQEQPLAGQRVLDAGSGSGLLAVAAACLGAAQVHGFDVDERAAPNGRELAEWNGVLDRCRFEQAGFEALDGVSERYGIVLANIYSDVIQRHAEDLLRVLVPGGRFAFSGCPSQHRLPTEQAIASAGLRLDEIRVRGRWHTFLGHRPQQPSQA
jgi:ribosomal protein L11 methyltransferase